MNRFSQFVLMLVPLTLFFAACTPSTTGSIEGKITCDDESKPVSDVTVALNDAASEVVAETKTDAEGRFFFADVEPGMYSLSSSWSTQAVQGDLFAYGDWTATVASQPQGVLGAFTSQFEVAAGDRITKDLAVSTSLYCSTGDVKPQPVESSGNGAAKQYDAPPPMTIDVNQQYFATFKMQTGGEFVVQLYPDKAPIAVNSFVFLARDEYFNGVTFHRVLEGFMAQGGDPTGTGMGGPGYEFVNEYSDLTFDQAGVVAMANAGPDTNGSQFFITFGPTPHLNGGYTIFGQVIEGTDVVNDITRRDPDQNPDFEGDVIESITITEQ